MFTEWDIILYNIWNKYTQIGCCIHIRFLLLSAFYSHCYYYYSYRYYYYLYLLFEFENGSKMINFFHIISFIIISFMYISMLQQFYNTYNIHMYITLYYSVGIERLNKHEN